MPKPRAASRIVAPSGTLTVCSSILISIWRRARGGACGTGPRGIGISGEGRLACSLMEQTPAIQRGFESARRGLAEAADGGVAHGLPHFPQRRQLRGGGAEWLLVDQAVQRLLLADGAD